MSFQKLLQSLNESKPRSIIFSEGRNYLNKSAPISKWLFINESKLLIYVAYNRLYTLVRLAGPPHIGFHWIFSFIMLFQRKMLLCDGKT